MLKAGLIRFTEIQTRWIEVVDVLKFQAEASSKCLFSVNFKVRAVFSEEIERPIYRAFPLYQFST